MADAKQIDKSFDDMCTSINAALDKDSRPEPEIIGSSFDKCFDIISATRHRQCCYKGLEITLGRLRLFLGCLSTQSALPNERVSFLSVGFRKLPTLLLRGVECKK